MGDSEGPRPQYLMDMPGAQRVLRLTALKTPTGTDEACQAPGIEGYGSHYLWGNLADNPPPGLLPAAM